MKVHSPLRSNMSVDQARNSRSEGLLLVATNPNKEPVGTLKARRQCCSDAGTCADTNAALVERRGVGNSRKLEFTRPECRRGIIHETACEIALHTTNHVVVLCMSSFRNNAKGVVLHDARTGDSSKKALLHTTPETHNCNLWRWQFNVDRYFTHTDPRDENADADRIS